MGIAGAAGSEAPSSTTEATRRHPRLHVGPRATLLFLLAIVAIEVFAARAADPDFFLPDPFHPFVAGLIAIFVVAAFTPWPSVRNGLLALAIATPIGVAFAEWRLRASDVATMQSRIVQSDDLLLRYAYRPGVEFGGATVTADGLLDVEHVVEKPEGVVRVVVLGDSVPNDPTIPFAERFPRKLEAALASSAPKGRRVEVINVSCEGYNTIQEVRLLERVGQKYAPDVVVVAYVLNDPFLQNGGYRRFGNSFFLFRLAGAVAGVRGDACDEFARLHDGYGFELVVRASLERLRLLAQLHGFRVLVAPLPIVAPFDDPVCGRLYDKVIDVGHAQGFETARLVDGFRGEDYRGYAKPNAKWDVTHPSAAAHAKIALQLADALAPQLWR